MGQVGAQVALVQSEKDVDALQIPRETPVAYVTQTTLSIDDGGASDRYDRVVLRVATSVDPDFQTRTVRASDGSKAPQSQQDAPFPQAGAFAQADREDANAALWKPTASSA